MPRITNIQPRRGTASSWISSNPVLADGEIGLETDTGKIKFGDGIAGWTGLEYAIPGGSGLQTLDPPGAWLGWKKALLNMNATPVRMLCLGDSITEGTGVTTRSQTWPNLVAQKIRAAYPTVPQTNPWGWVPIVQASTTLTSSFTLGGSYTTSVSKFGFRGDQTAVLNANATITFSVTATSIDIWHARGASSGTFTVKKDGVQIGGNYGGTNATTDSGFKQSISLGAAGTYTIVITNNSANPVYINGVTAWNGNENSGVNVVNAGRHGWVSQNWEDVANDGTWVDDIATYDPHLVTILLGANDYTSLVGRAAYKDNLRTVINKIRDSQNYFASIVLVACYKRSELVYPRWEHYEFAMRDLATEMGCGYIDLRDVMPDVGTQEAIDNSYYVDTVHPSAAGYSRMADEIARVLLDPNIGTRPANLDLTPVLHTHPDATTISSGFMSYSDKIKMDNVLTTKDQRGAWLGWREAVKKQDTETIRWLALGDSITEGTGSSGGHLNGWVSQVTAAIRYAYPNVTGNADPYTLGWTPATQTSSSVPSLWTPAANAGSFNSASSFGFRHTKSTAITNGATLTATITGTHIDVWWTQGSATTAFTVKVNGTVKATLGGSSGVVTSGFNSRVQLGSSATVPGTYTVVLTAGSGSSFINGVATRNNNLTSGIEWYNAAVHGWKTSDWVTATNHANWRQDYLALKPQLVTLLIGANDYTGQIGLDTWKTNLTTIVNNLRSQTATTVWPTIVLISCYKEDYTYDPVWWYYEAGMEQVADELGCAFINLRDYMPDPGTPEGISQGLFAEQIHPNNVGYSRIAEIISDNLLARTA